MAILGRYTPKDLKGCNKRKLFLECHFEDILNMTVAVRVARYARESTNHEDQIKALENQVERLDAFIADHENFVIKEKYKYTERGFLAEEWMTGMPFSLCWRLPDGGNLILS